eukprot:EG_transcript_8776
MGARPAKEPPPAGDFAALARAFPHVEERYLQALQPHVPLSKSFHHRLSRKKLRPAPKPEKVTSALDDLTVEDLCSVITQCCLERYGGAFDGLEEVVANVRHHMVDGATIRHLEAQDWQVLCPYIGPRIAVTEALRRLQTASAALAKATSAPPAPPAQPTPTPPAGSSGGAVASQRAGSPPKRPAPSVPVASPISGPSTVTQLQHDLSGSALDLGVSDESFILTRFVRPEGIRAVQGQPSHFPGRLAQPLRRMATLKAFFMHPHHEATADDIDVAVDVNGDGVAQEAVSPSTEPQPPLHQWQLPSPDPLSLKSLLFSRSEFSNHRLIDTPLQVDPSLRCWLRGGWAVLYDLVRAIFLAQIFATFFLRLRQLPVFLVPVVSITLCIQQGWQHAASPSLFTSILVFPLAFAVNAAYRRREEALQYLAGIKSSALMLYLLMRSWSLSTPGLPPNYTANAAHLIEATFRNFGHYLTSTSEKDREVILTNIYQHYDDLFYHVDTLRLCDLAATLMGSMISNLVAVMTGFERLRIFSDYRTPCTLRSYSRGCTLLINFIMA